MYFFTCDFFLYGFEWHFFISILLMWSGVPITLVHVIFTSLEEAIIFSIFKIKFHNSFMIFSTFSPIFISQRLSIKFFCLNVCLISWKVQFVSSFFTHYGLSNSFLYLQVVSEWFLYCFFFLLNDLIGVSFFLENQHQLNKSNEYQLYVIELCSIFHALSAFS